MRKSCITLGGLVVFLFAFYSVNASHFMGGQITYECLGGDQYKITLKLYQDCNGVEFLDEEYIRVTPLVNGDSIVRVFLLTGSPSDITTTCPGEISKCTDLNSTYPYGVNEWVYEGTATFPALGAGETYTLAHGRQARNGAITTCDMSADCNFTGWYITANIDPNITPCNSSPEFLNVPIAYICKDEIYNFNHNAFDSDGDSLVFSFVECISSVWDPSDFTFGPPYLGTYPPIGPVCYIPPYSATYPMPAVDDTIYMNSRTGEITFVPDENGVGIMSILVEEYRNGVKIGDIKRDIQITVNSCDNTLPELAQFDTEGRTDTNIYAGGTYCFTFSATDLDFLTSTNSNDYLIDLTLTSGLPGTWSNPSSQLIFNKGNYCISPTCSEVREQPYLITVIALDNACPIPGLSTETFEVYVKPPDPVPPVLFCVNPTNNDGDLKIQWENPQRTITNDEYKVYRANNFNGPYSLISTLSESEIQNLSYTDTDASLFPTDSVYYYYIELVTPGCLGDSSLFTDTIANIQLSSVFNDPELPFNWNAPVDNSNLVYELQRKKGGTFIEYDTTSNLIYTDTATNCTPLYVEHRIKVTDASLGCTFYSNVVYDTIPGGVLPPDSPIMCMTEVNINNSSSIYFYGDTSRIDHYNIYRFNESTSTYDSIGKLDNFLSLQYSDSLIDASTNSYNYRIIAVDTCGLYSEPSDSHQTINVIATSAYFSNDLNWNTYIDLDQDSLLFSISRADSTALNFVFLDTTSLRVYSDSGLSCNKRYYYRISVIYKGSTICDTILSDTVSAKPFDNTAPNPLQICNVSVGNNFTDVLVSIAQDSTADLMEIELYLTEDSSLIAIYSVDSAGYSFVDSSKLESTNSACYYVVGIDTCGNRSTPSKSLCSIHISALGGEGQIDINWSDNSDYEYDYAIIYRGEDGKTLDSIGTTTSTSFIDSLLPATCNVKFNYQIQAFYNQAICATRFSDTAWAEPFDGEIPDYPEFCIISVQPNYVNAFIDFGNSEAKDVITYNLFNSDSVLLSTFSLSDSTQYIDQNAIGASKQGCYFLQSVDSCGNSSPSSPTFCTINLTALPGISKNYLKWNSFKLWKPDGYNIYAGGTFPLKLISSTTDTTFVHDSLKCMDNLIYYQVEAYITDSSNGCHYSFSDTASTTCSEIELPNVFTPNQDDSHNNFIPIVYQNIVSIDIKIYNRWGQMVSRSSDIDDLWDGKNIRTKKDCKVGTYFYVADVELKTYETANTLTFHGHITLLR